MTEILQTQQDIVSEFNKFSDWTERYKHIISLGKSLDPMKDELKVNENIVKGCQSRVWLHAELVEDKISFSADSDAAIVRGLIALLLRFYSNRTPDDILTTAPDFISNIGMDQHLSMTRSNGLAAMVKQMKIYAMAFKAKMQLNR